MVEKRDPLHSVYRDPTDTDKILRIREVVGKKLETEGKYAVEVPETLIVGDTLPHFAVLLKKKVDPKDIILYSTETGLMQFNGTDPKDNRFCFYQNPHDPNLCLWILADKNNPVVTSISRMTTPEKEALDQRKRKQQWEQWLLHQMSWQTAELQRLRHGLAAVEVSSDKRSEHVHYLQALRAELEQLLPEVDKKIEQQKGKE